MIYTFRFADATAVLAVRFILATNFAVQFRLFDVNALTLGSRSILR